MRRLVSAVLLALFATPAFAIDWAFEDASIPIAYIDNGNAQFQFACRGGDLAMGYWVRLPSSEVAKASSLHLAILPDPSANANIATASGTSFAQDMPLIHADGTSMIVRGPVARTWARIAQKAKHTLRIAYVRKSAKLEVFDSNDFGASGSSAAIKAVLDRCG